MIGWDEIEKREFCSLARVPTGTLWFMLVETQEELNAVIPEGREKAADLNGFNQIKGQLQARGEYTADTRQRRSKLTRSKTFATQARVGRV